MVVELVGESKNILKCPEDPDCVPDSRGLGVVFMETMEKYSNNIAQIDAETGKTLSHGDVLLESIRVAQNLQLRNITTNDIICLCSYNNMECTFPYFAAFFLGVRLTTLDPTLPKNDFNYLLNIVEPRFIFCDDSCVEVIKTVIKESKLKTEIVLYGETNEFIPFSEFRKPTASENEFKAKPVNDLNDIAIISFSSGTTGFPKGVCSSHYALLSQQEVLRKACDCTVVLYFSTFYWLSASMLLISCLLGGNTRVVAKKFDPDTTMHIFEKYKVTYTIMAPIYIHKLIRKYKSTDFDTSNLSALMIIGSKCISEEIVKAKELFPNTAVSSGYGMTEASGYILNFHTTRDKFLINKKLESCGRPISGFTYKIVDVETNKILGPNEHGELRIKSKCVINEYYNNPEATKNSFDTEGYFKTGDIAYYDEDYCFYIVDRVKNILKYRNYMQSTASLEAIILTHPDVREVVVLGKPHPFDGDHAAAFVVLEDGSSATKEDILAYYNEQIMNYDPKKLRGGLYILDEIPRTPTGKPCTKDLMNLLLMVE